MIIRPLTDLLAKGGARSGAYSSTTLPVIAGHSIAINLPAVLIVAAVTIVLVHGIRESAHTNTTIVIIKICRRCVRHCVWRIYGEPDELASVYAAWFPWPNERRGDCVLRVHRLRRRFDDRGRNAQSASVTCRSGSSPV